MKALKNALPIGTRVQLTGLPNARNAFVAGYAFLNAHPKSPDAWLVYCVEYLDTALPVGEQTRVDLFGLLALEVIPS